MSLSTIKSGSAVPWQRTLWIMFFAQLMSAVGFSSIFPFLPLYIESLGAVTPLSLELLVGLVFSSQAFTMMIASPFWGALADRYSRKLMVQRAMFGGAVILLMMAFVRSAEELVLLRALQGMITGTIGASNAMVASIAPRERTGYAMSVLQVGLGGGVALGPMIGGAVADAFGYRAAFYVTAALLALAGIMVHLGVEENFTPSKSADKKKRSFLSDWHHVLSAPGVLTTFSLRFMNQLGRMIFIPILPLFLKELITETDRLNSFTGLVVGIASATTTASALYLGRMGDRIGHRTIVIYCSLVSCILFFAQCLVSEGWHLLMLQATAGIALGGIVPGISALLAGFTEVGEEGAVYGLDNSINSGARALAPMLGVGIAMWMGLRAVFAAAALLYLMTALLCSWRLPKSHPRSGRRQSEYDGSRAERI